MKIVAIYRLLHYSVYKDLIAFICAHIMPILIIMLKFFTQNANITVLFNFISKKKLNLLFGSSEEVR